VRDSFEIGLEGEKEAGRGIHDWRLAVPDVLSFQLIAGPSHQGGEQPFLIGGAGRRAGKRTPTVLSK